jgi:hypothetical protein
VAELPSASNAVQSSEMLRNSLGLNYKLDRPGRSLQHLAQLIGELERHGTALLASSQGHLGPDRNKAPPAQAPRRSTQRAGIVPPHAEGDGLSGVTSDRELNAFISGPAALVGGVPLTRAMNPWAMPEAST